MFTYLVIFTGVNSAQVFGANPTLGGVIGAVVLLTGMNPEAPIKNLFTGDALAAGQGGYYHNANAFLTRDRSIRNFLDHAFSRIHF